MPDQDGYPTAEELKRIGTFAADNLDGMMEFIQSIWWMPDPGATKLPSGQWELHTWGWSGNENIIQVMEENFMWWVMNWEQSRRGGHYLFSPMSGFHQSSSAPTREEEARGHSG